MESYGDFVPFHGQVYYNLNLCLTNCGGTQVAIESATGATLRPGHGGNTGGTLMHVQGGNTGGTLMQGQGGNTEDILKPGQGATLRPGQGGNKQCRRI